MWKYTKNDQYHQIGKLVRLSVGLVSDHLVYESWSSGFYEKIEISLRS